jgi:hypothetical protein
MRFGKKEIMVKKNTPPGSQPSGAYTHVQKAPAVRPSCCISAPKDSANPVTVA